MRTSRKLVIRVTGRRRDGEVGVSSERGRKVGLDDVKRDSVEGMRGRNDINSK